MSHKLTWLVKAIIARFSSASDTDELIVQSSIRDSFFRRAKGSLFWFKTLRTSLQTTTTTKIT